MLVPPRSGAENMARDTALMERARVSGEAVFSIYGWERPTLSLGRNQTARGRYDAAEIARRGMDVVRRPTGGRALLHYREVTYSVTAPVRDYMSLRESYSRINAILIDGLSRLGVVVSAWKQHGPAMRPGDIPCFAAPAAGELVSEGVKLVGSAQMREGGALLQHGSILIEDDQPLIATLCTEHRDEAPVPPAATLVAILGRSPQVEEVADSMFAAVRELEDAEASDLADSEIRDATINHLDRFASEWWTWRK